MMFRYPSGHARNTQANLESILQYKFGLLGKIAIKEKTELNRFKTFICLFIFFFF